MVFLHQSSLNPSLVRIDVGGLESWTVLIPVQDVPGIRRLRPQQRQARVISFKTNEKQREKQQCSQIQVYDQVVLAGPRE